MNKDIKKIIKGLEICYCPPSKCEDCPYHDLPVEQSCNDELGSDTLTLLKEQEQRINELEEKLSLVKEKEAVKPICKIIFDVPYYFCGNCKTMLNMYSTKAKFCSQCGRAVKWDYVLMEKGS